MEREKSRVDDGDQRHAKREWMDVRVGGERE